MTFRAATLLLLSTSMGCATSAVKDEPANSQATSTHAEPSVDDAENHGDDAAAPANGPPTAAHGVAFVDGTYEMALAQAQSHKQNLLVEVWADWCPPCQQQKKEIFHSGDGISLTRNLVAWKMDFDADENRPLIEKWTILNLPTVLFIRPDGSEIGRIEGYDDKASFLQKAEALALGQDELPAWQDKLAAAADQDVAAKKEAMVEVGHRLLVRGDDKGRQLLEDVVAADTAHAWDEAQEASFLLGRYHSRVRRDFVVGKQVWLRLHDDYRSGAYASTAAWWAAGAMLELGDKDGAVAFLVQRAHTPPTVDEVDLVVSFVKKANTGHAAAQKLVQSLAADAATDAQRAEWAAALSAAEAPAQP